MACHVYLLATRADAQKILETGKRMEAIAFQIMYRNGSTTMIKDGTHAFSYIIARAAMWDGSKGPCSKLLDSFWSTSHRKILEKRLPKLLERKKKNKRHHINSFAIFP